jgi:hypothetical protein
MATRSRQNFTYGVISGTTVTGTTVTGTGFPITITSGTYLPIIINPGYFGLAGAGEIAYVTATSGGGTIATLLRARENTSASGWSQGTPWVAGPTVNDFGMTNMVSNGDVPGGSIPAGSVGYSGTNTQTGSYVVASGDVNNLIVMNNTTSGVVTLAGTFAIGQQITVYRANTGTVAISGTSGATIVSTAANAAVPTLRAQYSVATAIYLNDGSGSGAWLVTGDLA